jgi:hypothetical protein
MCYRTLKHTKTADEVKYITNITPRTCTKHIVTQRTTLCVRQLSLQTNIPGISEGPCCMQVEPSRQSKIKQQGFAIGNLDICVCEEVATPQSEDVIP